MVCNDRQLTQAQRQQGFDAQRLALPALRPFTGTASTSNLVDYLNRELVPALRAARNRVNEIYRQTTDNAPSGNPLQYYFSTETGNADPTTGRLRLNNATQNAATVIRISETNARLQDAVAWLDVMAGSLTDPLGTVTLFDAVDPSRFLRFDLDSMTDQGDYWNLGVTILESSHDSPFVDGGAVALSFVPGVASGGTVLRYFPGAPIYDVMAPPFLAAGDGVTDDTAAINAAIAAANAEPGVVFLGQAHLITSATTAVTNNNIIIMGRGRFNGGTHVICSNAGGAFDAFTIQSCQYSGVSNMWISGTAVQTSGYGVRLRQVFRPVVDNVLISQMGYGVEIYGCTLTDLWRVTLDDLYGVYAFHAYGDSGVFCHATRFVECSCGTSFPQAVTGTASTWAAGQSITAGQLRFSNGAIYQAATSGTTGASAPNGIPGATPGTAHTSTVSDGGVSWYFAMPLNTWFLQESYAQTFEMMDCGALQGGYGMQVLDSNPGSGSTPLFTRIFNFQTDHPFARGIRLLAGKAVEICSTFITSVQDGYGFEVASTFGGGWRWSGGEVFGCSRACVLIGFGGGGIVTGAQIAAAGSGFSCIEVINSAENWKVTGCHAGATVDDPAPDSNYGIDIGSGCDNYTVSGNSFIGHVVAPIRNTPGQSTTRIVRDNIPKWAEHIASDGYQAVTIAGGATHTLTLAATTNTVFVTVSGSGTAVVDQIVHGAGNAGVVLTIVKELAANRLALRDGNAGTNSIWTPFSADYFLNAYNDSVTVESLAGRWRPRVPARFAVRINSAGSDFVRRRLNLIAGAGMSLSTSDDSTNEELDLTVDYTGTTNGIDVGGSAALGTVNIATLQCGGSVYSSSGSAVLSVEGFTAKAEGFWFVISFGSSQTWTLFNNDSTATAANRMQLPDNVDLTCQGGAAVVYYKESRWRCSVAGSGRLLARTVYSSAGSGTHTYDVRCKRAVVRMKGGGGAAGGIEGGAVAVGAAASGGGGAGADLELHITTVPTSSAYTVGAAGTGASAATGGDGGDTTFHDGSATRTAAGGSGGGRAELSATPISAYGGDGGDMPSATGAFWRGKGAEGCPGIAFNLEGTPWGDGGHGGVGFNGSGGGRGRQNVSSTGDGAPGESPGAGGGGSLSLASTTDRTGANGAPGLVIVEEYS